MLNKKIVYIALLICFFISCSSCALAKDAKEIIYPTPKEVFVKGGIVEIDTGWSIVCSSNSQECNALIGTFVDKLNLKYGINLNKTAYIPTYSKEIVICINDYDYVEGILQEEEISKEKLINDEAYIIIIKKDSIYVVAAHLRGVHYACESLIQLFKNVKDKLSLPILNIIDYPDNKIRAVHLCGANPLLIKEQLDEIAKLKYNTVIIDTWDYFNFENANKREIWEDIFDYARSLYIEPIPELQSFGAAGSILVSNPQAAEGIWVKDAKFRFINDIAKPLNPDRAIMTNILRNDETDIKIISLNKKTIYKENIDYEVIDETMLYPFDENTKPFVIKRKKTGRIENNDIVLISYDYVERKCDFADWSIPYCPSSQITYKIMDETIYNVVEYLKPTYISIGHDEIRGMNRDSRCLRRNRTNAELFAEDINRLYDITKKYNPDVNIIMWADMLNPWHNGGDENYQLQFGGIPGRTDIVSDMISNEIILILWHPSRDNLIKAPEYFKSKGFSYWADNIKWLNVDIKPHGVIITTWKGWQKDYPKIKKAADNLW